MPPLDPLRDAPLNPDPDHIARGLETRVLARLREIDADRIWTRRWSLVLGGGTAACAALLVWQVAALAQSSLAALDHSGWLILFTL